MQLAEYFHQFDQALSDEIAAARSQGGRKISLTEGRYLGPRDSIHLYSFTTDIELKFPDDTPVDLEVKGQKTPGYILSLHQFDLILGLMEHIGDEVASARLSTEPWFLLEELKKRLETVASEADKNRPMVDELLNSNCRPQLPDVERAQWLLSKVERETAQRIARNPHQLRAVGHVLANQISFIWGPPGTGKTSTLGATVAALVVANKSVLVMSHSNVAVDVAVLSIAKILERSRAYRDHRILRLGPFYREELSEYPGLHIRGIVRSQNADLIRALEALEDEQRKLTKLSRGENLTGIQKSRIKQELERIRDTIQPLRAQIEKIEREFVEEAQVIGCTLSKASIDEVIFQREFDAVLIDEASMVYIPHCAFASSLGREHVAIYGDFRQLPPISQAESLLAKQWLQRDIFEHTGIVDRVDKRHRDPRLVLLATQYRMHPHIAAIPNKLFYNGYLENGPDVQEQNTPITGVPPCPGNAVVLCDMSFIRGNCYHTPKFAGFSRFNLISALVAVNIAHRILTTTSYSIALVTPYNAQARLLRNLLSDLDLRESGRVTVDTVHRFQGSEQEVVVFDMVEAGNSRKPGKLLEGGPGSIAMRLANVAISRAKGKFILLADLRHIRDHFRPLDIFREFAQEIETHGHIYEVKWPSVNQPGVWTDALPQIRIDHRIQKAEVLVRADRVDKSKGNSPLGKVSGLEIIQMDENLLSFRTTTAKPNGPVIQLTTPKTIQLLCDFWELNSVPEPAPAAKKPVAKQRNAENQGPVGRCCPKCRNPLTPRVNRNGTPYLKCTNRFCDHTATMTKEDASYLAYYLKIKCEKCGGQAIGQKGKTVFIGCRNYPKCDWRISIADLLRNRPI